MTTSKKIVTTIRINDNIREKLRQQAEKVGMDVSNYIAYLVMYKEDRDRQEERTREMTAQLIKSMGNVAPDTFLKMLYKKGEEE